MRKRRIRVCHCPCCGSKTPLHPARDQIAVTVCERCFVLFGNHLVSSWLEDREEAS